MAFEKVASARAMIRNSAIALAVCTVLVVVCYYFVDKSVAFYVHDHALNRFAAIKWLTYPPPLVQSWSPLALVLMAASAAWRPWSRFERTLFIACLSLLVADEFRSSIGDLFGRYWPETWHDNNPSLLGTGTYGFHAFEYGGNAPFWPGDDVGSFPSGHAARILGFLSVFWTCLPRGRVLYALIAVPMCLSLILMNYHFVGDVIAGSFLGAIVGGYAVWFASPWGGRDNETFTSP